MMSLRTLLFTCLVFFNTVYTVSACSVPQPTTSCHPTSIPLSRVLRETAILFLCVSFYLFLERASLTKMWVYDHSYGFEWVVVILMIMCIDTCRFFFLGCFHTVRVGMRRTDRTFSLSPLSVRSRPT